MPGKARATRPIGAITVQLDAEVNNIDRQGLLVQGPQGQVPVGLGLPNGQGKQQQNLPDTGLVVGEVQPGPSAAAGLQGGIRTEQFQGGSVSVGSDVITALMANRWTAWKTCRSRRTHRHFSERGSLLKFVAGQPPELSVIGAR